MDDVLTEQRLKLLETHMQVQQTEMLAIRTERIEANRLEKSLGKLNEGANALSEALLKVDSTQQELTRLGKHVEEFEQRSATTEGVEAKVKEAKEQADLKVTETAARLVLERNRLLRRAAGAVLTISLVLFGLVFYTSNSAYEACNNRQDATRAVLDTLLSFRDPGNTERVESGKVRIEKTLDVTCSEQYFLHL